MKQNRKKHEASSNTIAIILSVVILLGCFIFSSQYLKAKKQVAYMEMTNIFYSQANSKTESEEQVNEIQQEEQPVEENTTTYIGYLEIPKINFKKGFYSKESSENDVEKNIYLVENSDYPNKEKGNLIIAGHSGTGWKAFFNDLYQLEKTNEIYVTYHNKKYTYSIQDIYTQKKTGTIAIYRDYSKTTLTLVTCTNDNQTTQTIYIAYLQKTEDI